MKGMAITKQARYTICQTIIRVCAMSEQQKQRLLTGDTPTGQLHLGHWVGSVQNRVALGMNMIVIFCWQICMRFQHVPMIQSQLRKVP